jgi:hypothetical protein
MKETIKLTTATLEFIAAVASFIKLVISGIDANMTETFIYATFCVACVSLLITTILSVRSDRKKKDADTIFITPEEVEEAERRLKRDGERAARDLHDELVRSELKRIKKENKNE